MSFFWYLICLYNDKLCVRRFSELKDYSDIDSKFRYVILASKRAKQLLKGAKPKIKSKSKNLVRVAQEEVKMGLVEFEIIQNQIEEFGETGDGMFIGEEIPAVSLVAEDEFVGEIPEESEEAVPEPQPEPIKVKGLKKALTKAAKGT